MNQSPNRPLQAILKSNIPEILGQLSLANGQTKALTDGTTKISVLTLFVTPIYRKLQKFENLSENRL